MTIRVAINGYGRIGRAILRAHYEQLTRSPIQIIAVNDLGKIEINAHLTRYDTTHGRFTSSVEVSQDKHLVVDGEKIQMLSIPDPTKLPWKELDIDVVYECTGRFTTRDQAALHLHAGAKKVLISAPAKSVDATVVYGVNHHILKSSHEIVSNGSCTTNCLATLIKPLHEELGIAQGLMTTIHAYTNDQALVDAYHSDPYRARSATQSMIPTKTGAAAAIGLVIPELTGKLDGLAIRVPTPNVSLVDLSFRANCSTDVKTVNNILKNASENELKNLLCYSEESLVSSDFNHHTASAIVAAQETRAIGDFVKVLAWYDNEWGFSNRMLDITQAWTQAN